MFEIAPISAVAVSAKFSTPSTSYMYLSTSTTIFVSSDVSILNDFEVGWSFTGFIITVIIAFPSPLSGSTIKYVISSIPL